MKKSSGFLRHTTVLFLLMAGGISVVLFSVKYQVQDLEEKRISLINEIMDEKRAIHVLNAEWSYLNDPSRLSNMSTHYLDLKPGSPEQLGNIETIKNIPPRPENNAGGNQ
ncbi:MAG: hypothetical protein OEX17_08335 [Rhodospirillaceae bacterium]|nr:hypothetical protein [Rhodospirillaceae bacterium]